MSAPSPAAVKKSSANVASSAAVTESQGVLSVMMGKEAPMPLTAGQVNKIKARAGQHWKLVREQAGKAEAVAADNVIATRQGDDLVLRYEDGTIVRAEEFFAVCADAGVCSVNLPGDAAGGYTLSGDSARGAALGEEGSLLYAHGSHNTLMTMAQGHPALGTALTGLGDAAMATYVPMSASWGVADLLSAVSVGSLGLGLLGGESAAAAVPAAVAAAEVAGAVIPVTTISGVIVAGAVTASNGLRVSAFTVGGALLASDVVVDANGHYSLNFTSSYTGAVLLKVTDTSTGLDYLDEASRAGKDLETDLHAVVSVGAAGQSLVVNVTPLTDLAARKIGLTGNSIVGDTSAAGVAAINNAVAKFFGLTAGDEQIIALLPTPVLDANGAAQASNLHGQILAAISGSELKGGQTTGDILATLASGIDVSGAIASFNGNAAGNVAKGILRDGISSALQSGVVTLDMAKTMVRTLIPGGDASPQALVFTDRTSFKVGDTSTVYFKLSAPSADFDGADIAVTGGALGALTQDGVDPTLYMATFTPSAVNNLSATVSVGAGAFTNQLGAENVASVPLTLSGDALAPTLAITDNIGGTAGGDITYTFTFSEGVTGFTADDVAVSNGAKGAFVQVNASTYTLIVTPTAGFNGNVTVDVAGAVAQDATGNASTAAAQSVQTVDGNEAPTVANAIADQTFVVGGAANTYTFDSNVFGDPDTTTPNNTLTYTATLGDGSALPAWLSFDALTRTFSGNPTADGAVTVRVTATDGGTGALSTFDDFVINVVSAPVLTSAFEGSVVGNFDVRSNIVLTASEALDLTGVLAGTKFIHLVNTGGAGYNGESVAHSYDIDVTDTSQVTISGNKIILNPIYDLDLANDYYITIDAGAFHGVTSGEVSLAVSSATAMDFSTVTPGTDNTVSAAVASQKMDAMGALQSSYKYLDVEGIGNNTGSMTALGSLANGQYALVLKNYGAVRGGDPASGGNGSSDGVVAHDTNIGVTNFGIDDLIYIDSQFNSVISGTSERYAFDWTLLGNGAESGGVAGQNLIYFGTEFGQSGSAANLVVGIEGNVLNTLYVSLPSLMAGRDPVWTSSPVIQG